MTKSFFIEKSAMNTKNTIVLIYNKDTIWIGNVPFPSLDQAWWYMLGILDQMY